MEKEMFEGMVATLTELGEDMQITMEMATSGKMEPDDYPNAIGELAGGISILARTLATFAVTNEAAKVLLSEGEE